MGITMTKPDDDTTAENQAVAGVYPTEEHLRAQNEQTSPSTGKPLNVDESAAAETAADAKHAPKSAQ